MSYDAEAEVVARKLASWAEYHEGNWRLYLPKAAELIAAYESAKTERSNNA